MASNVIAHRQVKLRQYRYPGELLSLSLTFLLLLSLYALATVFFPTSWSTTLKTLAITLAGLGVYVIGVKLQQRAAIGTMVKVGPRQFPELYELASEAATRLSAPYIPVYVKRASEMNIYTLGFWRQPLIVLTSSLVDQMEPDNLQFFIGREIGHVDAGHTWLRTLLKPLGADVPVIGRLLNSVIFGDWTNRAELTADRAGFVACRSLTTAVSTMLKFGVGIRLYEKLDIREFLDQIKDVRNVRGHLTQIVAEQPYLTQRVRSLVTFALSDEFRALVPEKSRHTRILDAIPEAFVSSRLKLEDLQVVAGDLQRAQRPPTPEPAALLEIEFEPDFDTVFENESVTVSDFDDLQDENGPDPNLLLVATTGETRYVLRRQLTRIGRTRDNDIVLDSDRVSRYHAEIFRRDDRWMISDQGSRNGIFVNNQRVKESVPIESGDLIRIGRQEFTFLITE
ncbi:MAG: FHA domain-containing protein [Blastocatellia bacterium]|nr:FHA domain-containing protein [Blastocatellia bacterium]